MLLLLALAIVSQVPSAVATGPGVTPPPAFEVASVKPFPSTEPGIYTDFRGDSFIARNITVRELLWTAYTGRFRTAEIVGGPDWLDSERYEIVAKKPQGSPASAFRMLQTLLAQRFGLRAHVEPRETPIYRLVRAKPGRLGPNLTPSGVDCQNSHCSVRFGNGEAMGNGMSLSTLVAGTLESSSGRRIVDETRLTGQFNFSLEWATEDFGRSPTPDGRTADPPPGRVSLFTALEEQLGLRLEPAMAPVQILVIDAVERPDPN